ncbi:MAG: hypothetical protein M3Y30_00055 [Gemmatimonadota bacterium]|nr:hypothetical protein [Gemmatimonadota bacterium]
MSDSPAPRDGLIARIKHRTSAQLWIVAALGVGFYLVMHAGARIGQCGLFDSINRCGMATFVAEVFGVFGAIVIWIGLGGRVYWAKRRRERRLRNQRLHDENFVDPEYDSGAAMLQNRLEDDERRASEDRVRNRRA